ncbi:low choriolytic enzyme-like [Hemiscyllium ocellatum]|uniref:low choriolytic enzyme-like n=1 Tax=Hemiscyllium ocellatum TaxID=170820 RepID=UPI0029660B1C|nr:low choriolytic enzyme-like [Hemiscyllium ocellatum]
MNLNVVVVLVFILTIIHLQLVGSMNSTNQGVLKRKQRDTNETDVFSIILKANEELLKSTGSKIIEHGDILVDNSRNAMICNNSPRSCLWPRAKDGNIYVPYKLGREYNVFSRRLIKRSLDEIAILTCIKFYHSHKHEPAFIDVNSEKGCFAVIGYKGRRQKISLQIPDCLHFGVIAHEFLHAIGFHHEHCRSDRNKYVKIFMRNVVRELQYNFNILHTNNLGTEYDYSSIMHYGRTVFSRNGLPTILPIPDPNVEIGQIRGLSTKDVAKINKLYNCEVPPLRVYHDDNQKSLVLLLPR